VPLFSFEGVGVRRDGRWIVDGLTVDVSARGVTAVIGPSGAGKSTVLRLCNRLEVPDAGTIRFRGLPLSDGDVPAHRRRVGLVQQRPVLLTGTVRGDLAIARPSASEGELNSAITSVGLPVSALDADASRLSAGEAQRACLARTLITGPSVLLLDEPTSALDTANRLSFERLVLALARGRDGTGAVPVLWVTHDHGQLHRVADHVLALRAGRSVFAGPLAGLPPAPAYPSSARDTEVPRDR
jgi:putative ABC transport system ATP-binding protein